MAGVAEQVDPGIVELLQRRRDDIVEPGDMGRQQVGVAGRKID